ncbi:integrase [Streptomyces sp. NBC_01775]|uniref:integrase n=1 Tax=Streptomyces sp. NBC_01775 TaxID=2975939 RepID=UPI002DDC6B01|nr:integrase [Streptomyces sp. NBC_01775]WSB74799.1 integrase [Streptomyces sp. NBC_01775]
MPYIEWRGGSCRVKWWAGGYLPSGKKKYESASGPAPGVPFQDETAAYNYGLDREHDVRHGKHISRSDRTTPMESYCWTWLAAQDLRPESVRRYTSILTNWIVPYWRSHGVGEITSLEYDAWKKYIQGKVGASHAIGILSVFSMLMEDAVLEGMRSSSPVVKRRRRGRYVKKAREKKHPLDVETVYRLAVNAHTVWGYTGWTYIWTMAFTGMRTGEMWGLRREFAPPNWPASDPDPERREECVSRYTSMQAIRVQHQHQYVEGVATFTGPKYESHRTLVVPPFLAEMLGALLASHDKAVVFPSMSGGYLLGACNFGATYWWPISRGASARVGRKDTARPEIPSVPAMSGKRIYLLRHGHKEWLEDDGHLETPTEARMGHEIAGVKGLYGNVTPGMELRIIETLQARWEKLLTSGVWLPPFPSRLPSQGS